MTTASSPTHKLKAQADKMAAALKAAERGEPIANDPAGKIAAARARDAISFMVAMDDKFIKIEMPWSAIRETSEAGIAEYIVAQMRGARDTVQ